MNVPHTPFTGLQVNFIMTEADGPLTQTTTSMTCSFQKSGYQPERLRGEEHDLLAKEALWGSYSLFLLPVGRKS